MRSRQAKPLARAFLARKSNCAAGEFVPYRAWMHEPLHVVHCVRLGMPKWDLIASS